MKKIVLFLMASLACCVANDQVIHTDSRHAGKLSGAGIWGVEITEETEILMAGDGEFIFDVPIKIKALETDNGSKTEIRDAVVVQGDVSINGQLRINGGSLDVGGELTFDELSRVTVGGNAHTLKADTISINSGGIGIQISSDFGAAPVIHTKTLNLPEAITTIYLSASDGGTIPQGRYKLFFVEGGFQGRAPALKAVKGETAELVISGNDITAVVH